ncbi:MAG: low affinity iron permease family protein [Ferruginibacter sp.]
MNTNKKKDGISFKKIFYRFSAWVTKATGKPAAFLSALFIVIIWGVSGPLFHYSENWQLVINTGTTIITFLMIFVIQQSQNRDTAALHLKLNELIATNKDTSNRLVASEDLTEEELEIIKKYYKKISEHANSESVFTSHSLDEAGKDWKNKLEFQAGNKNSKSKN